MKHKPRSLLTASWMFSQHILCICVFSFLPSILTTISLVVFQYSVYSKWNFHPLSHGGQKAFHNPWFLTFPLIPISNLSKPCWFPLIGLLIYIDIFPFWSRPPSSLPYTAAHPVVPSTHSGPPPVYSPASARGHFPKYRAINQLIDLSFHHLCHHTHH